MRAYRCSCGGRHPASPHLAALIEGLGPNIRVRVHDGMWLVPRIYIAAHGLRGEDVAPLAHDYGWKRVHTRNTRRRVR